MTVIRMTIFIGAGISLSRHERTLWVPNLFSNDLYVSHTGPFKVHRLCAISHTRDTFSQADELRGPEASRITS